MARVTSSSSKVETFLRSQWPIQPLARLPHSAIVERIHRINATMDGFDRYLQARVQSELAYAAALRKSVGVPAPTGGGTSASAWWGWMKGDAEPQGSKRETPKIGPSSPWVNESLHGMLHMLARQTLDTAKRHEQLAGHLDGKLRPMLQTLHAGQRKTHNELLQEHQHVQRLYKKSRQQVTRLKQLLHNRAREEEVERARVDHMLVLVQRAKAEQARARARTRAAAAATKTAAAAAATKTATKTPGATGRSAAAAASPSPQPASPSPLTTAAAAAAAAAANGEAADEALQRQRQRWQDSVGAVNAAVKGLEKASTACEETRRRLSETKHMLGRTLQELESRRMTALCSGLRYLAEQQQKISGESERAAEELLRVGHAVDGDSDLRLVTHNHFVRLTLSNQMRPREGKKTSAAATKAATKAKKTAGGKAAAAPAPAAAAGSDSDGAAGPPVDTSTSTAGDPDSPDPQTLGAAALPGKGQGSKDKDKGRVEYLVGAYVEMCLSSTASAPAPAPAPAPATSTATSQARHAAQPPPPPVPSISTGAEGGSSSSSSRPLLDRDTNVPAGERSVNTAESATVCSDSSEAWSVVDAPPEFLGASPTSASVPRPATAAPAPADRSEFKVDEGAAFGGNGNEGEVDDEDDALLRGNVSDSEDAMPDELSALGDRVRALFEASKTKMTPRGQTTRGGGAAAVSVSTVARQAFIKHLNRQRCRSKDLGGAFDRMSTVMDSFLDACVKEKDIKSARSLMIMSQTFFRLSSTAAAQAQAQAMKRSPTANTVQRGRRGRGRQNPFGSTSGSESERALQSSGAEAEVEDEATVRKEFMSSRVLAHPIWKNPVFWEEAFLEAVRAAIVVAGTQSTLTMKGDDAERTKQVCHVYRQIVFSQLLALTLNMIGFGMSLEATKACIIKMSLANRLSAAQTAAILEHAVQTAKSRRRRATG